MTRVDVPDGYEGVDVPLPEQAGMEYGSERDVVGTPGRVAQVREDADGRYVGVPEQYADDVRAFLGVGDSDATDEADAGGTDEVFTCVGADGECSREVETEGGTCWQHTEDEEGGD